MRRNPKLDRAFARLDAIVAAHKAAHGGSGFNKLANLLRQAGLQAADIRSLPPSALAGLATRAHAMAVAKAAAAKAKPKPAACTSRG